MPLTNNLLHLNIEYLMNKAGISSVTELARLVKMQQPTLHRMLRGEVRNPKYTTLSHIATLFGISPVDLIEQDLQALDSATEPAFATVNRQNNVPPVPVLGDVYLGHNSCWNDAEYSSGNNAGHLRWLSGDRDAYALKCASDSMTPRIKEGEFIIIEPNQSYHPGDEVLVVTQAGNVMVQTFLFERAGYYHLSPVNEDHAPIRLACCEVARIQYIAGIARSALWSH